MTRLEALKDRCSNHILYQRLAKKMSESEFDQIVDFIEENDELDHIQFEYAVNRMFLDKNKPKNWVAITELLTVCNTASRGVMKHVQDRRLS